MLSKILDKNVETVDFAFEDWGDIVKRRLFIGENKDREIFICYIDDMANRTLIEGSVLKGLMLGIRLTDTSDDSISSLLDGGVTTADIKYSDNIREAIDEVMAGNSMLLIDGYDKAIIISTKGFPKRGVDKPENEIAVQGPKEAFAESIRINTVLIRRRIRDVNLKCKQMKIGRRSKTDVAVMYLKGTVREDILAELIDRLEKIDIDAVLDSGYIEQYIEDNKSSPFPLVQLTERPDKAAAEILEGRIAVVVDNSPFVMLVPVVLASFYQASEDYYQRWEIMSFVRLIRYLAGFLPFPFPVFILQLPYISPL